MRATHDGMSFFSKVHMLMMRITVASIISKAKSPALKRSSIMTAK